MQKIQYEFENREATIAAITEAGQTISNSVMIDLDQNGRPTNCYFEVEDAPPAPDPTYEELLEAYNIATGGVPE